MTTITTGFVGLGSQGAPMAQRMIDAGFPTTLWARRPETLLPYASTAASYAENLAELGATCEHIGICVVDDAGVIATCDALLPTMRPGSRIAIHSTVLPQTCIDLAKKFAARGIGFIDAPVSGGEPGAKAGTLTVMVGATAETLEAARPVFESFARLIIHLGPAGAGQHAKLVNNTLMAANLALADAAMNAGAALGLDRAALIELIKLSSGHSFSFDVRARLTDVTVFSHGARLLEKDVGLLSAVLDDPSVALLRNAATPLLDKILHPKQ
jgi:3-hydroxyisobutyrate dehydrogenase